MTFGVSGTDGFAGGHGLDTGQYPGPSIAERRNRMRRSQTLHSPMPDADALGQRSKVPAEVTAGVTRLRNTYTQQCRARGSDEQSCEKAAENIKRENSNAIKFIFLYLIYILSISYLYLICILSISYISLIYLLYISYL